MGLLLITRFTLQEVVRRRLFLAIIIITALLVGVFALLLSAATDPTISGAGKGNTPYSIVLTIVGITISVLSVWAIYLMSSTLTILLTANMISGEIEAGTFAIIVPKPLRRAEIVLGKWLAYAILITLYTALLFVAFLSLIYWKTGYLPNQVVAAFGMIELGTLTLLGLTTFFGSFVPTMVNGAIALMLFIGAPLASVIQFVVPTQSSSIQNISTIINLIIPTDALWHNASYYLLPDVALNLIHASASQASNLPVIGAQQLPLALLIWVILYATVLPLIAAAIFQRRDL